MLLAAFFGLPCPRETTSCCIGGNMDSKTKQSSESKSNQASASEINTTEGDAANTSSQYVTVENKWRETWGTKKNRGSRRPDQRRPSWETKLSHSMRSWSGRLSAQGWSFLPSSWQVLTVPTVMTKPNRSKPSLPVPFIIFLWEALEQSWFYYKYKWLGPQLHNHVSSLWPQDS